MVLNGGDAQCSGADYVMWNFAKKLERERAKMMGVSGLENSHSVHSQMTARSSSNLHTTRSRSRSVKSLKSLKSVPWYRRPHIQNVFSFNIQRASMFVLAFSLFLSVFTVLQSAFDLYCLALVVPGSVHFGPNLISYQFVYVGNRHVRNTLVLLAMFSLLGAVALFVVSVIGVRALRREDETRIVPWLIVFGVFVVMRTLSTIFYTAVNDMIFAYNAIYTLTWLVFGLAGIYGWLVVYSLYLELRNLTKLEDLAHLRINTIQSLNASAAQSLAGSRPTTPFSQVSMTAIH